MMTMNSIDYDELLNKWHDKVIEKADKFSDKADNCEIGSRDYLIYKNYSDGLYMALAMLSREEQKAKLLINKTKRR